MRQFIPVWDQTEFLISLLWFVSSSDEAEASAAENNQHLLWKVKKRKKGKKVSITRFTQNKPGSAETELTLINTRLQNVYKYTVNLKRKIKRSLLLPQINLVQRLFN